MRQLSLGVPTAREGHETCWIPRHLQNPALSTVARQQPLPVREENGRLQPHPGQVLTPSEVRAPAAEGHVALTPPAPRTSNPPVPAYGTRPREAEPLTAATANGPPLRARQPAVRPGLAVASCEGACAARPLGRANSNLPLAPSLSRGSRCADVIARRPSSLRFPALARAVSAAERGGKFSFVWFTAPFFSPFPQERAGRRGLSAPSPPGADPSPLRAAPVEGTRGSRHDAGDGFGALGGGGSAGGRAGGRAAESGGGAEPLPGTGEPETPPPPTPPLPGAALRGSPERGWGREGTFSPCPESPLLPASLKGRGFASRLLRTLKARRGEQSPGRPARVGQESGVAAAAGLRAGGGFASASITPLAGAPRR